MEDDVTVEKWQLIKTAPKDGTRILLYGRIGLMAADNVRFIGRFDRNDAHWRADRTRRICAPTHWMPLPQPPRRTE